MQIFQTFHTPANVTQPHERNVAAINQYSHDVYILITNTFDTMFV